MKIFNVIKFNEDKKRLQLQLKKTQDKLTKLITSCPHPPLRRKRKEKYGGYYCTLCENFLSRDKFPLKERKGNK